MIVWKYYLLDMEGRKVFFCGFVTFYCLDLMVFFFLLLFLLSYAMRLVMNYKVRSSKKSYKVYLEVVFELKVEMEHSIFLSK